MNCKANAPVTQRSQRVSILLSLAKIYWLEAFAVEDLHQTVAAYAEHEEAVAIGEAVGRLFDGQAGDRAVEGLVPMLREEVEKLVQVGQELAHVIDLERALDLDDDHLGPVLQQQIDLQYGR